MKTAPTETDREAARLFALAPGMRAWCRIEGAEVVARILGKDPVTMHAHAYAEALGMHLTESLAHNFDPAAIDSDDPASVGCMAAQVEQLATLDDIMDRWPDVAGDDRWMLIATVHETQDAVRLFAPTLGALVVAAMKVLKGAT